SATWPATDRILVCVSPSPLSVRLVRAAKRLAAGLKAEWVAAYVETPAALRLPATDRQRVERTLQLAEQLGAKVVRLSGQGVADELIAYALSQNVTRVVIGKPQRPRWRELLFGSVVDDLVRRSGDIDIYVIRGEAEEDEPRPAPPRPRRQWDARGYAAAVAISAAVTAVG